MTYGGGPGFNWSILDDPPAPKLESDEDLRSRLLYVAGDSEAVIQRIMRAKGEDLDLLADEYSLKRRKM